MSTDNFNQYTTEEFQAATRAVLSDIKATVEPNFGELGVVCDRSDIVSICKILKNDPSIAMEYLRSISVVDWIEHMEIVYHLSSIRHMNRIVIKVVIPLEDLKIDSVITVWSGADWHEREGHDLFGVEFIGHPDMSPLILYEGFEGFPGRKSYEIPVQETFYGD